MVFHRGHIYGMFKYYSFIRFLYTLFNIEQWVSVIKVVPHKYSRAFKKFLNFFHMLYSVSTDIPQNC